MVQTAQTPPRNIYTWLGGTGQGEIVGENLSGPHLVYYLPRDIFSNIRGLCEGKQPNEYS